jgi:predicted RNA binding protein YcfA (HicA-like mRNA interferase family)
VKLPRDLDGPSLVKALGVLGYEATRQKGSHIRVTTQRDGENHEVFRTTIPSRQGRLPAF